MYNSLLVIQSRSQLTAQSSSRFTPVQTEDYKPNYNSPVPGPVQKPGHNLILTLLTTTSYSHTPTQSGQQGRGLQPLLTGVMNHFHYGLQLTKQFYIRKQYSLAFCFCNAILCISCLQNMLKSTLSGSFKTHHQQRSHQVCKKADHEDMDNVPVAVLYS